MKKYLSAFCFAIFCFTHVHADDWKLSGGKGQKLDGGVLEIAGTGEGGTSWTSEPISVNPGDFYRFSMEANSPTGGGGGSAPCGLLGLSRDFTGLDKAWKSFSFIFKTPADRPELPMRVGQWSTTQTFRFRNMKLEPVVPIYRGFESPSRKGFFLQLGDGEMIRAGKYRFNGSFGGEGANALRPFYSTTTGFNSNRFTVGGEQEIKFGFMWPPIGLSKDLVDESDLVPNFEKARVEVNVNYHVRGTCSVYASWNPGKGWGEPIGTIDKVGTISAEVSPSMLPSPFVFIMIKGDPDASFQVDGVNFEADVNTDIEGVGETVFADVLPQTDKAPEGYSSTPLFFDEQRTLYVEHRNESDKPVKPMVVNPPNRMPGRYQSKYYTFTEPFDAEKVEMPAKSVCFETKPYSKAPEYRLSFSDIILKYSFRFDPYRDADFGYWLGDNLWWAEPDWKISPVKAAPAKTPENVRPIRISAAKNDYESFQLVVNGLQNMTLTVDGDLQGPDGATIPAQNVELRYAYYHFVHRPTDKVGSLGDWPDALPPLAEPNNGPIDVAAKRNLPLWVTVYVPKNAKPGEYAAKLILRYRENDKDVEQAVPFELKVWNFALPRRNTLQTAYGRGLGRSAFRYHNCKTDEDRRAVLELYHENFAKYRISGYDPTPLDPIRVTWNKETKTADIDFSAFDREMARVVEKYNITGFRLRVEGMGWGTYEGSVPGKIAGFEEGTPEYEALFSDYVKKLEAHLKEKGWLDMAYVYWFDEPAPKDYEFVAKGFAKLQKHAPGLARMITEEPNAAFIEALDKEGVKIDIWCPVSYNYNDDDVKARQKLGEKFWWYVCTGPKEPYCTLFIDHPGIELRMWHWQTWQRNIVGTLVWESIYWSSDSAFPDNTFQNPYDDPMGYVAGGPKGSKRYWGNGDGRFVYPPLEAAMPGMNDGNVVLKPPVSSIRWEMIREGVEDYEMLVMLRNLKEKHPEAAERIDTLLTIPAGITAGLTVFSVDPAPLYQRRKQVAELIETLLTK